MKKAIPVLALLYLAACTKKSTVQTGPPTQPNPPDQMANGAFFIQTDVQQTGSTPVYTSITGSFTGAKQTNIAGGTVSIGNYNLYDTATTGSSDVHFYTIAPISNFPYFGHTAAISINPNVNGNTSTGNAAATFYFPTLVQLQLPLAGSTISSAGGNTPPTTIKWAPDPGNNKPITISLSYDPTNQANAPFRSTHPFPVVNNISITDNGSYALLTKDLTGFAPGSIVTLKITRYNDTTLNSPVGSKSYYIRAVNTITGVYMINKSAVINGVKENS